MGFIYKAGSSGVMFFFSFLVLLFCIYLSITDGGIAVYIATAVFSLFTLVLLINLVGKLQRKKKEKKEKRG